MKNNNFLCKTITNNTTHVNSANDTDDLHNLEFTSLREEKLFRYQYANQLTTQLLTLTAAIWTIAFAVFDLPNKSNMYDSNIVIIEYFHAILFLFPAIFSSITFKQSLNNTVRLHLLSDYLRYSTPQNNKSWERMKPKINSSYFNNYEGEQKSSKIGEILFIHKFIALISVSISAIMGIFTTYNCIHHCAECEKNECGFKTYIIAFVLIIIFIVVYEIILSFINNKMNKNTSNISCGRSKFWKFLPCIISVIILSTYIISNCEWLRSKSIKKISLGSSIVYIIVFSIFTCIIPNYRLCKYNAEKLINKNEKAVKEYFFTT